MFPHANIFQTVTQGRRPCGRRPCVTSPFVTSAASRREVARHGTSTPSITWITPFVACTSLVMMLMFST